jgi:hypothetical protein
MSTPRTARPGRNLTLAIAVFTAIAMLLTAVPVGGGRLAAGASPPVFSPATFDLFSMFPQQYLSPATGRTFTWIPLETRNIAVASQWTWLSASSESPYFNAFVMPSLVRPVGAGGVARSWVLVNCSPDTPEGTVGNIKVTGIRGSEKHRVWLKVTALSSLPQLENSAGHILLGQGYRTPELQAFTGKPLSWTLEATNLGGARDTYQLSYSADFDCQVKFTTWGAEIGEVAVNGRTHNYIYSTPVQFMAEVTPNEPLPKNQPLDITFRLGPGGMTASTSELTMQVMNPGMLYCANDLAGIRPHVHQVMPAETTTFMFHVTNLNSQPEDITLALSVGDEEDAEGWDVSMGEGTIAGLAPGETRQVVLSATAGEGASVGDRLDLTVTAESSLEASDSVSVAAEVTDVRNVYYFSIDSMDPDYLYLNRAGTAPGSKGDWLMPNLRAFMGEGVSYTDARSYLPAATDMNHTNALAGTYTGTQGIYMVGGTFTGFTAYDEVQTKANSMGLMRYGDDGDDIKRIFEVAKDETGGKALTGFWSNKNWLTDIQGQRSVDIVAHSERFPLFFPPPYKHVAGDPQTDENPWDPLSAPFVACFYSDTMREILIPALLGQFDLMLGLGLYVMPISLVIGLNPGGHCEDRYLADSFFRSMIEEDPDVCYFNAADLDNTGHFTGSSWDLGEWDDKSTPCAIDDVSMFSPWMRRDECLDICREVDELFADFIQLLKDRGVYDNSIIVVLSDHSMENVKDKRNGYEVLDLRLILRQHGLLLYEDYYEGGGTQINFIWCDDTGKLEYIEETLEGYTVNDPVLGPVQPLMVVNRKEMKEGVDYGDLGRVRAMELYSEFWVNNPDEADGHLWPDLMIFPLYNYNVASHGQVLASAINPVGITLGNVPDNVQLGFPAAHGGLSTTSIPLIFKAPSGWDAYAPGTVIEEEVEIGDIAPTIYQIMGWEPPGCVDGKPLPH